MRQLAMSLLAKFLNLGSVPQSGTRRSDWVSTLRLDGIAASGA